MTPEEQKAEEELNRQAKNCVGKGFTHTIDPVFKRCVRCNMSEREIKSRGGTV